MDDAERQPLLGRRPCSMSSIERSRRQRLFMLICISIVAVNFAKVLSHAPELSILEYALCDEHTIHASPPPPPPNSTLPLPEVPEVTLEIYPSDEPICKSAEVQHALAVLTRWKDVFHAIPGVLLALPYGYAADRVGRKPIVLLSLTGVLLEAIYTRLIIWWHTGPNRLVPLRALWFVPLFQIIGGGSQVASSMAYAMVTDIFPAKKRTSIFFLISAALTAASILATALSAIMTSLWSPLFPFITSPFLQSAALVTASKLAETMPSPAPDTHNLTSILHHQQENDQEEQDPDNTIPLIAPTQSSRSSSGSSWHTVESDDHDSSSECDDTEEIDLNKLYSVSMAYLKCVNLFLGNKKLSCLAFSVVFASVGREALQFIVEYTSNTFGWGFVPSWFVLVFKGVVSLVALFVLLPRVLDVIEERYFLFLCPAERDYAIVRYSACFLAAGGLIIGLSGSVSVVFVVGVGTLALGWGYFAAVRSLAFEMGLPGEVGMVSCLVGSAQSLGSMIAAPTLARAFDKGLAMGGFGFGLPYLVAGLFFAGSAWAVTFWVKVGEYRVGGSLGGWEDKEEGEEEERKRERQERSDNELHQYITDVFGAAASGLLLNV